MASRRSGDAQPSITLDVDGDWLSSGQIEVANKIQEITSRELSHLIFYN
jgi:hypothetical protein